jgi:hypothetical protein
MIRLYRLDLNGTSHTEDTITICSRPVDMLGGWLGILICGAEGAWHDSTVLGYLGTQFYVAVNGMLYKKGPLSSVGKHRKGIR